MTDAMQSPHPETVSSLSRSQGTRSTDCRSYGTLGNESYLDRTSRDGDFLIDGTLEHGSTYDLSPKVVAGFEIWPLLLLTGLLIGLMGYVVAVVDPFLFDLKDGYCKTNLMWNRQRCCSYNSDCMSWIQWSDAFHISDRRSRMLFGWVSWTLLGAVFATTSAMITLSRHSQINGIKTKSTILYPVSGSGVAELKLRSKGIQLPGYFDLYTTLSKIVGIILSASSGLCLGKEGPYIHIAAGISSTIGDVFELCGAQSELLYNAGAAAGFCVAFGAPISGLIFVLEELPLLEPSSGRFTSTLFCCITAATFLKYLDPYGLKAIVMFHVHSMVTWKTLEIPIYACIGLSGGILGSLFVKSARFRLLAARKIPILSRHPMFETALLAVLTGLITDTNRFTKLSAAEALAILTTPCQKFHTDQHLHDNCPSLDGIPAHIRSLAAAFIIKGVFTVLTFGLKVPAGIYVPTMVLGALFGKIVGHVFQLFVDTFSLRGLPMLVAECANEIGIQGSSCISPGTYALIGAGSFVCGVTRLPVTLIVVLVEITERFDYLVPFMLAIILSNWSSRLLEPDSIYDVVASVNGYHLLEETDEAAPSAAQDTDLVS